MEKRRCSSLVFLALVVTSILCAAALRADDAVEEVKRLSLEIAAAKVRGDAEFLGRVWADDYAYTTTRGEVRTRAQGLADYRSGAVKWEYRRMEDVQARVYGDTAIVTARSALKGRVRSQEREETICLTEVYVKRGSRWRLVALHESRLEPER
jgi:uncharacterized protein (TIGR02246 family)